MSKLSPNAQKWVDALRSGEFEQGCGTLDSYGHYCCLGVACVIAEREGVSVKRCVSSGEIVGNNMDDQPRVQDWLGLSHEEGGYMDMGDASFLTADNDNGLSFSEIADIIEAHADELFVASTANGEGRT